MEFSRQKYWHWLPFLSPGDLPDPGIEPRSPALQEDSLPFEPSGRYTILDIKLFHLYESQEQVKLMFGFPGGSVVKNPSISAGYMGLMPGLGRYPGEGNDNPSSILDWEIPWTKDPVDRWTIVHGVTKELDMT